MNLLCALRSCPFGAEETRGAQPGRRAHHIPRRSLRESRPLRPLPTLSAIRMVTFERKGGKVGWEFGPANQKRQFPSSRRYGPRPPPGSIAQNDQSFCFMFRLSFFQKTFPGFLRLPELRPPQSVLLTRLPFHRHVPISPLDLWPRRSLSPPPLFRSPVEIPPTPPQTTPPKKTPPTPPPRAPPHHFPT